MNQFPLLTFISFPKISKKIFVAFIYRYGYLNEDSKHFGHAHLLEHYAVSQLETLLPKSHINGSVGNGDLRFEWETTARDLQHDLDIFLRYFREGLTHDAQLFEQEKFRILAELHERYENFLPWVRTQTVKSLIQKPQRLIRPRESQRHNIESANLTDIARLQKNLIRTIPRSLIIGSNKFTPSRKTEISAFIKNYIDEIPVKKTREKVIPGSKQRMIISDIRIPEGFIHQTYVYMGYSLREDLAHRYALSFLVRRIYTEIEKNISTLGAYSAEFEHSIEEHFGFVRFYLFVPEKHKEKLDSMISTIISQSSKGDTLNKEIHSYVQMRKKAVTKSLSDNTEYTGWTADDIFDFGAPLSQRAYFDALDEIDEHMVKRVARKIFAPKNLRTLTVKRNGSK